MKPNEAIKAIDGKITKLQRAIARDLPRLVGKHAVDFYQDNFAKQGFQNNGIQKWQPAKRLGTIKGADGKDGTLLSRRKELYNSIHPIPGVAKVTIRSDKPYSRIHNEGGNIPITDKMRKWAWAKYYETSTEGTKTLKTKTYTSWSPEKSQEVNFYKGLALTKKKQLHIPKRQFMGRSADLNTLLNTKITEYVNKIFKE